MKIETVIEPNDHIFEIQRRYVDIVSQMLPGRHIEMVGGMAVPMISRPELGILVITDDVKGDALKLEALGFGYLTLLKPISRSCKESSGRINNQFSITHPQHPLPYL